MRAPSIGPPSADIEYERSGADMELVAAAKQAKAGKAQARKPDRLKQHTAKPDTGAGR